MGGQPARAGAPQLELLDIERDYDDEDAVARSRAQIAVILRRGKTWAERPEG